MKRHAIFVDAGYLFAQGSVSIVGRNSPRTDLKLNEVAVVDLLKALALSLSTNAEILRVYWYDGAKNGPTTEHLAIANMQDVKLRLGSINSVGQQKEVDSLLVTDLIDLARNQSICDATVVAGDSDVRVAVQIAQTFGVRVHLVGLEPSRASQSPLLRLEADTVHEISRAEVATFLETLPRTAPAVQATTAVATADIALPTPTAIAVSVAANEEVGDTTRKTLSHILDDAIQRTLGRTPPEDLRRLKSILSTSNEIPQEIDGRLLGISRTLLERDLTGSERRNMRKEFKRRVLSTDGPTT